MPQEIGVKPGKKLPFQKRTESIEPRFRISLVDILNGKDARTTLMIRNIPNKCSQKMLLQKIDFCHNGQYNFFYLPIDLKVSLNYK